MKSVEAYRAKKEETKELLSKLQAILEGMDSYQSKDPRDWGIVGDRGHVNEVLRDLVQGYEGIFPR